MVDALYCIIDLGDGWIQSEREEDSRGDDGVKSEGEEDLRGNGGDDNKGGVKNKGEHDIPS
jgi:hypothetical protein